MKQCLPDSIQYFTIHCDDDDGDDNVGFDMYQPTNVPHPGPDKERTVMSMREGIDYISYIYYIYNIFLMVGLCVCVPPSKQRLANHSQRTM